MMRKPNGSYRPPLRRRIARSAFIDFLFRDRWEPPLRRNRHGELVQPQVSPPYRVISGCLSLFMVWAGWMGTQGGLDVGYLVVTGGLALPSGWIALFGWNATVMDPEASDRFRELADPSRPLSNDDGAPGR